MPLTKRNAHELRLPQMPDAPLSPAQLAMMMMMVMTMAMGNAAMSASAFAFYSTARERKNNEHLVRRKGVLWIWLGKSSVRLPAWLRLPGWLFELLLLLSALLGSALAALMKNSFIVWNFALKCKIVFQTSRTQSALWALPTRREMLWKDAVKM